nr:unnamed protein product [Digitaria exilis]
MAGLPPVSERRLPAVLMLLLLAVTAATAAGERRGLAARVEAPPARHRHAYAAMMYMGTPRDYEFYVAVRVMMRSLTRVRADADRVLIASSDVPRDWVRAMAEEDGMRVVIVDNLRNPYENNLGGINRRFKLTLNKLYAWTLVDYERVVMIDSDNIFLHNTDELFQCGQFCAVFINPCYFHTGLFVLQPSMDVFKGMLHDLEIGRENSDGADQGFLVGCYPDLLDKPMFHPPENGTKLNGTYRLPLGYQMDASYYFTRLAKPGMTKLCYNRRPEKQSALVQWLIKLAAIVAMVAAYSIPFFVIPRTVHPVMGWSMYLFGALALSVLVVNVFLLPPLDVLTPWLAIVGMLFVMAFPWYHDGVVRVLAIFAYAFCSAPFLWASLVRTTDSLQTMLERDPFFPRLGEPTQETEFSKLY